MQHQQTFRASTSHASTQKAGRLLIIALWVAQLVLPFFAAYANPEGAAMRMLICTSNGIETITLSNNVLDPSNAPAESSPASDSNSNSPLYHCALCYLAVHKSASLTPQDHAALLAPPAAFHPVWYGHTLSFLTQHHASRFAAPRAPPFSS